MSAMASICPVGLTVIVKVFEGPEHATKPLVYVGVTVIVAEIGCMSAFVGVKEGIFPSPEAPRPIAVLSLVHA